MQILGCRKQHKRISVRKRRAPLIHHCEEKKEKHRKIKKMCQMQEKPTIKKSGKVSRLSTKKWREVETSEVKKRRNGKYYGNEHGTDYKNTIGKVH